MSQVKSLYIHIPFCEKKCPYCDFTAFQGALHEEERYVKALVKEIGLYKKNRFETVYIGGGTPTLLSRESLKKIFSSFEFSENAEITIESNPGVSKEKLTFLKTLGINRISFGAQSFQDKLLKILGRAHTAEDIRNAVKWTREVGISNINLDLIYAIPTQTTKDIEDDLQEIAKILPTHISYYSLIWEEGTKFHFDLKKNMVEEVDDELEASWYFKIDEFFSTLGYGHYEISNFSQKGYESNHNQVYWRNEMYFGVGLGASGYIENKRYSNIKKLYPYYEMIEKLTYPREDVEILSNETIAQNKIMLGLRLIIEGAEVPKRYQKRLEALEKLGKIEKIGKNYRISKKYWYLSNQIIREIIFD
ncbi:MAG: radical SAM family heme chaperone HemW [Fusobacteria bacterium]|nr:radical SAM family heme chaperone HemW [Fusobacteriota bacterium]